MSQLPLGPFHVVDALPGLGFPEALRWHNGALYFSDMFRSRVLRWTPGSDASCVIDTETGGPSMPGGLGWLPDGTLLVVDCLGKRVLAVPAGAAATPATVREYADLRAQLSHPANDMHVDADGTAWVGGYGFDPENDAPVASAIVRIAPDGTVSSTDRGFVFPNGFARGAAGLIVAETFADRVSAVADGSVVAQLPPGSGPDGISLATDGTLLVALAFARELVAVRQGDVHTLYRPEPITIGPGAGDLGCYDCAIDPVTGRIALAVASADEALAERVDTGTVLILEPLP